jgi:hypothetical protein
MTPSRSRAASYSALLERIFDPAGEGMAPALAERILEMNFPESDAARAEELSEKANEGLLNADEEAELETYVDVGDLLAVWQSKARQRLRNTV